MLDPQFLKQLNRFSLIVRKRITSNYAGGRRSIAVGRGLMLEDHRQYVKGDEIRLMNWKMYAKTDKLYVKQFEEERSLTVHIIIDKSTSMNFGKPMTKFEYGAMIGLGFAYLAMKENDKFEFTMFDSDLRGLKPKKGMSQMASIMRELEALKIKGDSDFSGSMQRYKKLIKSRSMIIVISDFLYDKEEIEKGLARLGRKNEIKIVQVLDREEVDLKIEGYMNLHDSETGTSMKTYVSKRLQDKYQHMMDGHTAAIKTVSDGVKAKFYQVVTDAPLFDSFYRILKG
jgi:uncharacterized protein (DUF58 family)